MKIINKLILIAGSIVMINSAYTEDLKDIYQLALKNDPTLKVAKASYKAGKEYKTQGLSGLLPSVSVSAQTSWQEFRLEDTLLDQYNSNYHSASLSQPLFRLDKWFQFQQGKSLSKAAEAEFSYQQQETMIRVATSYFNVLNAMDALGAAKAEEQAIGRQRDQSKKRYDVGLASITEVHETQAAYDTSVVSTIVRESQLDSAKEALSAIIGGAIPLLSPLKEDYATPPPTPMDRESWVKIGLKNNLQLKTARLNEEASKSNAKSAGSNHLPKVDIVGNVNRSTSGQGKFGGFITNPQMDMESDNRQYSIRFSMPIFQGGYVSSARRQAYAQYEREKQRTVVTERSVINEIRSNHFSVQTQSANVKARKQSLVSSRSSLEATKIGFDVGSRNVVDLLQSERSLYAAQRDYSNSRYEYIIAMLRLKASVGSLSPEDLISISNQMK
ncbi:MAG: TolC family outer membrane protein [Gammaproteobacteria bacterium]